MSEMVPTNWPNPERPGLPIFPDRNGEHKINYFDEAFLAAWIAEEGIWFIYDLDNYYTPKEAEDRFTYYHGAVLTPTQISEMLAGERERCANVCKTLIACEENRYGVGLKIISVDARVKALSEARRLIRNLGDAP